jgi:hypothetical protein
VTGPTTILLAEDDQNGKRTGLDPSHAAALEATGLVRVEAVDGATWQLVPRGRVCCSDR